MNEILVINNVGPLNYGIYLRIYNCLSASGVATGNIPNYNVPSDFTINDIQVSENISDYIDLHVCNHDKTIIPRDSTEPPHLCLQGTNFFPDNVSLRVKYPNTPPKLKPYDKAKCAGGSISKDESN